MSRLMVSVSGIRGEIGLTLTPDVAARFGAAFATILGAGKTVVVGRDSRPTGPTVRNAVVSGMMACGVNVIDLGIVTTPGVALMTRTLEADGGVVITASHNPIQWNGIKFLRPNGIALSVEQAAELKKIWQSEQFSWAAPTACGDQSSNETTHETHIAGVLKIADVEKIRAKKFKVVLDSVNGAGCVATRMLLEALNCEIIHENGEPTGIFAHTPEPTAENLTSLCDKVKQTSADIGFAQDPDADRLAMVDETGRYIGEEFTLAICANYVLANTDGSAAANLSTSRMIDDIAAKYGRTVFRTPVGEANVAGKMLSKNCVIGGEGNGGIIDPRVVPVRDSLVGIALALNLLAETNEPLSAAADSLGGYQMIKTKFPCPADAAPAVAAATRDKLAAREGASFNDSDGLRVDLPEGWVHVRASNTEPIMRIIAEAADAAAAEKLVAEVREIADAVIGK